ncbi:12903_t:CDS:2, partial [Dentiscutata erythropus]
MVIAKLYANSLSQVIQKQNQETDINWLVSDLDMISNEESLWNIYNYQENKLDIKLNSLLCNGLKICFVFQNNDFVKQSTSIKRIQYICILCFMSKGRYLFEQRGQGVVLPFDCTDQHYNNSSKSLQFLAKWINNISEFDEKNIQHILLDEIFREIIAFFE